MPGKLIAALPFGTTVVKALSHIVTLSAPVWYRYAQISAERRWAWQFALQPGDFVVADDSGCRTMRQDGEVHASAPGVTCPEPDT